MATKTRSRSKAISTQVVPTKQELVPASREPYEYANAQTGEVRQPNPVVTSFPDLPEVLESDVPFDETASDDAQPLILMAGGCYLARYTPTPPQFGVPPNHFDGTFRVERAGLRVLASGDLYWHKSSTFPGAPPLSPEPNPNAGIPVFARKNYSFYLRVTRFAERTTPGAKAVAMNIDFSRFANGTWGTAMATTALLKPAAPPAGVSPTTPFFSGEVKKANSTQILGSLTLCWVSKALRRATIEIDRCAASEWPLDNGSGADWKVILGMAGWDVKVVQSNSDVVEPSGNSWSNGEMHSAMLTRRDSANLDAEWRYHILCVRNIDATPRGIMYDNGATDSNNVPREGVGIASHWTIPMSPEWGTVQGKRFGTAPAPYFRTAVHELGHAMGLYHNTIDLGIMNTTDVIAAASLGGTVPFPDNIQWAHATDDQSRLRHLPDVHVRPGGTPFGTPYGPDANADEAVGLEISVTPVMESFPIGAPVRLEFVIVNRTDVPLPVPKSLSMKSGNVRGQVIDPAGGTQQFVPMLLCVEEHGIEMLPPGESRGHSLTLLRGPQGSLFPAPGAYRIQVDISWDVKGAPVTQRGETSVMVTPPESESHSKAALKVLSTPDTVVALVVGGDHLKDGLEAIQVALDDETLRPHFAAVEAKRVGNRFNDRAADVPQAARLMMEKTVATSDEKKKLAKLAVNEDDATKKMMAKALK